MQPDASVITSSRPNRVLIALAAAWMILSLAIGGAALADTSAEARPVPAVADSARD